MQAHGAYWDGTRQIAVYQRAYHELGDPEALRPMDKHFVVQRRGGGGSGGAGVEEWATPRASYQNTNMLGQLPALLDPRGQVDTLLRLRVADDVAGSQVSGLALFVLLSGEPAAEGEGAPREAMTAAADINTFWDRPGSVTAPFPRRLAARLRLRVNGVAVEAAAAHAGGWLRVDCLAHRRAWAVGENLVAVSLGGGGRLSLEKVELRVAHGAGAAKL